jgi:subtilisin family serine protease
MPRLLLAICLLLLLGGSPTLTSPSAAQQSGRQVLLPAVVAQQPVPTAIPVFVELHDAPTLRLLEGAATSAMLANLSAHTQKLRVAQTELSVRMAALGVRELFRAQLALNGVAVFVEPANVAALFALPDVAAVYPLVPKQPALTRSLPSIGALQAWSSQGNAGQGVTIGIADTGIDYTHATFGGPGTPQAYSTNNRAVVEPGTFPTAKVVGGIDLAGDAYDAQTTATPNPDPDPLDCRGHGTQVASTAAGFGVTSDGQTYRSNYTDSLDLAQFSLGPGVAPRASLYAIKIFGCSGGTNLVIPAIERALDPNGDGDIGDRLPVLSLAVSGPFGDDDPDVAAVNRAARAGLVVVAPAGNSGNTFYSLASPGNATGALSVAAENEGAVANFSARGPARNGTLKPDLAAPGAGIRAAELGSGTGAALFEGTSAATAHAAGAAALVVQRRPEWNAERVRAALTGTARRLSNLAGQSYPASLAGAGALAVDQAVSGDLLAYGDNGGLSFGAPTVISATWTGEGTLNVVNDAPYERLVAIESSVDVAQDGVSVEPLSTTLRIGANTSIQVPVQARVDGTRLRPTPDPFTAPSQLPSVSGAARQFLPEHSGALIVREAGTTRLRLAQLADLIATDLYIDGQLRQSNIQQGEVGAYTELTPGLHRIQLFPIGARGQGTPLLAQDVTINLGQSLTLAVTGWSAELRSSVLDDSSGQGASQVRVLNGASSLLGRIDVYIGGALLVTGLAPGQSSAYLATPVGDAELQIRRAGSAATSPPLLNTRLSLPAGQQTDVALVGRTAARLSIVTFAVQSLRVPYSLAPVLAARASIANAQPLQPGPGGTFNLTVQNDGARNNPSSSARQLPLASVFELGAASPNEPASTGNIDAADLRYVGVGSDFSASGRIDLAFVYFAVATHSPWHTPNEVLFRVEIDTDATPDGVADFRVESRDLGQLQSPPQTTDTFVGATFQRSGGSFVYTGRWSPINGISAPIGSFSGFDTKVYNSSVLFLQTPATLLGLDARPTFRYRVLSFARDAGGFATQIDATAWQTYDITRPTLSAANRQLTFLPLFPSTNGATIPVTADLAALSARRATLLVLHHHNVGNAQAELVVVGGSPAAP